MSTLICFCFLLLLTIIKLIPVFATYDTYIIHMDSSAMPKIFSDLEGWYFSTLATASETDHDDSVSSKIIYTYTKSMAGFSASLLPAEHAAIMKSPGYVSSIKDMKVHLHTTHSFEFLGLNSKYGAWPKSKYGEDVIIGVVDSGVWPESQSFNDDGNNEIPSRWKGECEFGAQFNSSICNRKLIGARYFNKGLIARSPNLTISMNSARDSHGHGTHTSSTAGGSWVNDASFFGYAPGISRGMAPRAHVAIYKAFFDEGAVLSDVLAAIDRAILDGVDVLSLSFGYGDIPLHEDVVAIATFEAMRNGIFVAMSSGNDGPSLNQLHNGVPWTTSVAAGTIDREFQGTVTLGNGFSTTGFCFYLGNLTSKEIPLVFIDGCEDKNNLKKGGGKIVVCLDTTNVLFEQLYNVQNSEFLGGIFVSNSSNLQDISQNPFPFPALVFNLEEGQKVLDYVKSMSETKGSFQIHETRIGKRVAPQVAYYSSRGPSKNCPFVLKPDILAPGDAIFASWTPLSSVAQITSGPLFNQFNIISGTSMSCPHVAGVATLLKSVHPDWSPAAIRSAMMTTVDVIDNTGFPIKDQSNGEPASPLVMGAGHINPNRALDPGLVYDASPEDYINLLCGLNLTSKHIQTITGSSSYNCSRPSLDLNYPSFIAYFNVNGSNSDALMVQEFERTVTKVEEGRAEYVAELTPLDGLEVSVSPNRLEFGEKNEKKSYRLRVEGPKMMKDLVVYGSLTWVEIGGEHRVRSPIVATNLVV